jgi:hypothetical protein
MIAKTAAAMILIATLCGCGTIAPPPKYDRNIKPATSSHSSLTQYLDTIVKGGKLASNWCKDRTLFATELFTPTKFEILGAPSSDTFYSEQSGAYWTNYTVRIWSTNKGGIPIVNDWSISVKYGERQYSSPGNLAWCIDFVSDKNR